MINSVYIRLVIYFRPKNTRDFNIYHPIILLLVSRVSSCSAYALLKRLSAIEFFFLQAGIRHCDSRRTVRYCYDSDRPMWHRFLSLLLAYPIFFPSLSLLHFFPSVILFFFLEIYAFHSAYFLFLSISLFLAFYLFPFAPKYKFSA
jgi:hypothetical protein